MNLRDLNYLVAVADLRSFIKASERCCISQPTLSTQIKKMEGSLGVKLFERTNKKVLPTDVGEQIIASARLILQQVDGIAELAKTAQDPLAGDFRLGAFPTLSTYIFPALVPEIKSTLPNIRLILMTEKTDILIQQLKEGELDAALLALPLYEDFLEVEPLFEDEFKLAIAPDHPLASKRKISSDDLFQQQLLLLDEGHCLRGQALQVCQLNGAEEQQDVRATGLETLRQMVKAGTGMTFMPEIAISDNEQDICYIPFEQPAPSRQIGLVWRKTSARIQLMHQISQLIISIYKIN